MMSREEGGRREEGGEGGYNTVTCNTVLDYSFFEF